MEKLTQKNALIAVTVIVQFSMGLAAGGLPVESLHYIVVLCGIAGFTAGLLHKVFKQERLATILAISFSLGFVMGWAILEFFQ